MSLREWLGFGESAEVEEARRQRPKATATAIQDATPANVKRAGFEFAIPPEGLNEYNASVGESTQSDRRALMQQLYESYLACPWAWACVNAIARTITGGPLVFDWDNDDGEGDQDAPPKPPEVLACERLFQFTNPREDIRQLMRSTFSDLLVFGDAFIEVVWLAGVPAALYSLDSPSMFPIADEHGNITGYVQVTDYQQRAEFKPHEVIHISLDSPRSGMFGVSPTQAALLPLTSWLFTAATLKEIYRKGGPINVHVDMPASQADNDIKRWLQQYMSNNIGPRNIGRPILTKGGAAVHELGMRQVQELLHTLDQKRDEIVAAFGVPPAEAGIIESGNLGGGTGESQRRSFIVNTCQPLAALVLEKLDYHLVRKGFGIKGWHLKFEEVDMRDSLTIESIRDMRLRNGAYVLNKYRNEIGEPPVDGGDEPVLVDRQNLVLWADMPAASRATIAYKLKGTDVQMDNPDELGSTVSLQARPAPPSLPPGLVAGGATIPGQPPPQMPAKPGALAPAKPGATPAEPAATPAKPAGKKAAREDYPGRSVREDYRATYAERLRRALTEMPEVEHDE